MSKLANLRQEYPDASIISFLQQIHNGLFIVRVGITIGESTISAIASGATVEDADDKALNRALELFFTGSEYRDPGTVPNGYGTQDEKFENAISVVAIASEPIEEGDIIEYPVNCDGKVGKAKVVEKRSPKKEKVKPVEVADLAPPTVEFSKDSPLVCIPKSEIAIALQETKAVELEVTAPPVVEIPLVETPVEPVPSPAPVLELATETVSQEPIDFSEIISKSDREMKRLNWTGEHGKNYLLQTYGKRSRQLLSDAELIEFLEYLENQPDPDF